MTVENGTVHPAHAAMHHAARHSINKLTGVSLAAAIVCGALVVATTAASPQAVAQQPAPPPGSAARPAPPAPKQQTKRAATAEAPAPGSEASLRQRLEQLEEQLVDLQVVVGTVESLARGSGGASSAAPYRGAPPSAGGSGADAGRIAALETQVQALSSQLEQMSSQLRSLQSGAPPRGPSGPAPRAGNFGTTTVVTPNDPIASIINTPDPREQLPPQRAAAPQQQQSMSASPHSRQQYDQAYALLLQQNYPAAEAGFSDFLQQFPSDEMSPNAQFWLGETFFVRGQWDSAAASFLKVAQTYPRAEKAPDSLAKFAMAMERKGNRPGACRALQELNARYPSPPAHVRSWEMAERRRAGCT